MNSFMEINDQIYDSIVRAHAFIIIFFMVVPILVPKFRNYSVPLILTFLKRNFCLIMINISV